MPKCAGTKRIIALIAGGVSLSAVAARSPKPAAWVYPADRPAHCAIAIKLKKRVGGQTETILFRSELRTEDECRTLAAMHEPNFNEEVDESKRVAFKWNGPRERKPRRKSAKSIARREGRGASHR